MQTQIACLDNLCWPWRPFLAFADETWTKKAVGPDLSAASGSGKAHRLLNKSWMLNALGRLTSSLALTTPKNLKIVSIFALLTWTRVKNDPALKQIGCVIKHLVFDIYPVDPRKGWILR